MLGVLYAIQKICENVCIKHEVKYADLGSLAVVLAHLPAYN
jgi:hypothetical protein